MVLNLMDKEEDIPTLKCIATCHVRISKSAPRRMFDLWPHQQSIET